MTFQEQLVTNRKYWKWTQQKLAHHAGVGLSTVQSWEAGRAEPSLSKLQTLVKVLKCRFDLENVSIRYEAKK